MRLILTLLVAALPALASAQVYMWKDASGKIHYSDRPVNETQARKLKPPPEPILDTPPKAPADKEKEEKEKAQKTVDAAKDQEKKAAAEAERQVQCERARTNLQGLESGLVRFTLNSKGERVALEGTAREAELANARKAVESWCK